MNCNDTHACALAPVLFDLRKNANENTEAQALPEFMEMHEAFLSEGDSFDTCDLDLHFLA